MRLSPEEIARATGGQWRPIAPDGDVESISTDTRSMRPTGSVRPGDLFVALRGENFDGHDFLDRAAERGAMGLVVSRPVVGGKESARRSVVQCARESGLPPLLVVPDTLRALGDIAIAWRRKCGDLSEDSPRGTCHRTAIVGSCGKTTTKEMLAAILREHAREDGTDPVLATRGNLNNLIGLPLTLFGLRDSHRWAVLELGMNEPGELKRLTEIADPHLLLLLNIGRAHVGKFGSLEALLDAKADAVRALRSDVPIVYDCGCGNTCKIVQEWGKGRAAISFGVERFGAETAQTRNRPLDADVRATRPQAVLRQGKDASAIGPSASFGGYRFILEFRDAEPLPVEMPLFGRYNIENAAAAAAAAHTLGASPQAIVRAIGAFRAAPMRSEIREIGGVTLVIDCYNANPESMSAALDSLEDLSEGGRRRVFLALGDMLELGDSAGAFHAELGRRAARIGNSRLFSIGDLAAAAVDAWTGPPEGARRFGRREDLAEALIGEVGSGDLVFFKASRGVGLETVVELLEAGLRRAGARAGS
ncbi:MAG TPA: Mur ligase family protein [Sumerlaeia bacterium]|nr:Mur ligase family protein [Sumerlaeia bacterium]